MAEIAAISAKPKAKTMPTSSGAALKKRKRSPLDEGSGTVFVENISMPVANATMAR